MSLDNLLGPPNKFTYHRKFIVYFFHSIKFQTQFLIAIFRDICEIVCLLEFFSILSFSWLAFVWAIHFYDEKNDNNSIKRTLFFGNCCCKWRKMRCFFFLGPWCWLVLWRRMKKKNNTLRILLLFHIPFVWMCAIWRYIYTLHKHNTLMWRIPKTIWIQYRSFDCHRWRCIPKNTPFYREQSTIA